TRAHETGGGGDVGGEIAILIEHRNAFTQPRAHTLERTPSLKAPMHGFVVRVPLRQHVPLRACVENPQDCFEHTTRWSRFAPRTSIGNSLLRKMIPDTFPLLVHEPNHSTFISDRQQAAILR